MEAWNYVNVLIYLLTINPLHAATKTNRGSVGPALEDSIAGFLDSSHASGPVSYSVIF